MRSNAGRYFDFEIGTQWRSLTSCGTNMLRSASRPRKRCLLNARKMDELAVVNPAVRACGASESGDLLERRVFMAIIAIVRITIPPYYILASLRINREQCAISHPA